jgi:hypothetical protein
MSFVLPLVQLLLQQLSLNPKQTLSNVTFNYNLTTTLIIIGYQILGVDV